MSPFEQIQFYRQVEKPKQEKETPRCSCGARRPKRAAECLRCSAKRTAKVRALLLGTVLAVTVAVMGLVEFNVAGYRPQTIERRG